MASPEETFHKLLELDESRRVARAEYDTNNRLWRMLHAHADTDRGKKN